MRNCAPGRDDTLRELRRQIRDHRIEYWKSGLRHAQPAAVIDDDGAFFAQHGDAAGIE